MKTNKEIINEKHKGLVKNWGESAQLLSFNQVMELMDLAKNEVTLKFLIKKWLRGKKSQIIIPDSEIIRCVIETKQFHGSQDKFKIYRQSGSFYRSNLKFIHDFWNIWGGHDVQFHSFEDFKESVVKIL